MRYYILLFCFFIFQKSSGQDFLTSYKKFYTIMISKDRKLDSLRKSDPTYSKVLTRKNIKEAKKRRFQSLQQQIAQFDSIFKQYKQSTGFDFNLADSITIIYLTSAETNLRDYLFYSGKDTITCGEEWQMITLHSSKRIIVKKSFFDQIAHSNGTDRDSLINIANSGNCGTAQSVAEKKGVFAGFTVTIIKAKRTSNGYFIEECFLSPFGFVPIRRKE